MWGCGPVGLFAISSAFMLGASRVLAIDRFPERLALARSVGAITVNYAEDNVGVLAALKDLTGGMGPDSCIDAVGLEADSSDVQGVYDAVKTTLLLETDRPAVLRQAIQGFGRAVRFRFLACMADCWTRCSLVQHSGKASRCGLRLTSWVLLYIKISTVGSACCRPSFFSWRPQRKAQADAGP